MKRSWSARSTLDAWLIGINNRDLNTFETHLETTERLIGLIPPGRLVVVGERHLHARPILQG